VPPSVQPAGAQGGTSACSTGAALSFVSCIRSFGSSFALRVLRGRAYRAVCHPATRDAGRNGTANSELIGAATVAQPNGRTNDAQTLRSSGS
jgi:hypothetical protein